MPPVQPIKLTMDTETKRSIAKLTRAIEGLRASLEELKRFAPKEGDDNADVRSDPSEG